uniref:Uncharacterized protein n=1 Tax=Anguilla anguilla TaxID=7936 RepID=A0A0E9WD81_ANGAN
MEFRVGGVRVQHTICEPHFPSASLESEATWRTWRDRTSDVVHLQCNHGNSAVNSFRLPFKLKGEVAVFFVFF